MKPNTLTDKDKLVVSFQVFERGYFDHIERPATARPVEAKHVPVLAHTASPEVLEFRNAYQESLKTIRPEAYYRVVTHLNYNQAIHGDYQQDELRLRQKLGINPINEGKKLVKGDALLNYMALQYGFVANQMGAHRMGGSKLDVNQYRHYIDETSMKRIKAVIDQVTAPGTPVSDIQHRHELLKLTAGFPATINNRQFILSDHLNGPELNLFDRFSVSNHPKEPVYKVLPPSVRVDLIELYNIRYAPEADLLKKNSVAQAYLPAADGNPDALKLAGIKPDTVYYLRNLELINDATVKPDDKHALGSTLLMHLRENLEITGRQLVALLYEINQQAKIISSPESTGVNLYDFQLYNRPAAWDATQRMDQANQLANYPTFSPDPKTNTMEKTNQPNTEALIDLNEFKDRPNKYRYNIDEVKNMLMDKIDIVNNAVTTEVAKQIDHLLYGRKSDLMIMKDGTVGKLLLINGENGVALQQIHTLKELKLEKQFLGHEFTERDRLNLQTYGNMGRLVQLIDQKTGDPFKGYIGVDKDLNRVIVIRQDKITIQNPMAGVELTPAQLQVLKEGKSVRVDNMKNKDGNTFSAYVRIHAGEGKLKFSKINTAAKVLNQTQATTQQKTQNGPLSQQPNGVHQATPPQKATVVKNNKLDSKERKKNSQQSITSPSAQVKETRQSGKESKKNNRTPKM